MRPNGRTSVMGDPTKGDPVGEGGSNSVVRMAAADGATDGPLTECIKGCSEKTTDTATFLACVASCKAILPLREGAFSGSRIVIIG
jgi:hypothetical protein